MTVTIVVTAILLDLLLGDPRWLPHPVVGVGKLISFLERWLRQVFLKERLGGVLLLILTVGTSFIVAHILLVWPFSLNAYFGIVVGSVIAWTCLAARSLHGESKIVADALKNGDLVEARRLLSRIVGRDTEHLSEPEVWRALVETVAENTSDGVIAPLFYLMVGGPAIAIAYKAVNTLDSMVGYKNEKYKDFGWASARVDDLANYIPSRITGLLMVLAAPLVGLSASGAWGIMRRDGRKHSSPNSGIPEAAAAGALGVRIGGTNLYFGKPVEKPTIGDPLHTVDERAWRGAVRLMYVAEFLLLMVFLITTFLAKWN